jgi:Ca2+-binding EF-hand superfamily protein
LAKRAKLPVSQVGELREIFRLVDTDGNGCIDKAELRQLADSLKIDNVEYVEELIAKTKIYQEGHSLNALNEDSFTVNVNCASQINFSNYIYSVR